MWHFFEGHFGLHVFDETVTGESYLEMLAEIVPDTQRNPAFQSIVDKQDGAPPHFALSVRQYLNGVFPSWIGRGGKIAWPARSPDLTPWDYSLWGIIKDMVYPAKPNNKNDLEHLIRQTISAIDNDIDLCRHI